MQEQENNRLVKISKFEQQIREMIADHQGRVYDVTTTKGMKAAKDVRAMVRRIRIDTGKAGKVVKDALNAEKKQVDAEVKKIADLCSQIEDPVHALIKAEEDRKAEEKRKKEEAEAKRVGKIKETIQLISTSPERVGRSVGEIKEAMAKLKDYEITDFFAEFKDEAEEAKVAALSWLGDLLDAAEDREAEEQRKKEEAERLEAQRKEQERRERELAEREARLAAQEAEKAAQVEVAETLAPTETSCASEDAGAGTDQEQEKVTDGTDAGAPVERLSDSLQPVEDDDTEDGLSHEEAVAMVNRFKDRLDAERKTDVSFNFPKFLHDGCREAFEAGYRAHAEGIGIAEAWDQFVSEVE